MEILAIFYQDTSSWNGTLQFKAVAADEDAAKRWVQDEVDGRHGNGGYARGYSADWWIKQRTFVLKPIPVHT